MAVTQRTAGAAIRFDATLSAIGRSAVVRLPETASRDLPSRGQVAVHGTINGAGFQTVLEPDGNSGHWMRVDDTLQQAAGIGVGDTAAFEIEVAKDWPEPGVPGDLAAALASAPQKIQKLWNEITPMARWEWVRWGRFSVAVESCLFPPLRMDERQLPGIGQGTPRIARVDLSAKAMAVVDAVGDEARRDAVTDRVYSPDPVLG
jgi:hypothetical protein